MRLRRGGMPVRVRAQTGGATHTHPHTPVPSRLRGGRPQTPHFIALMRRFASPAFRAEAATKAFSVGARILSGPSLFS